MAAASLGFPADCDFDSTAPIGNPDRLLDRAGIAGCSEHRVRHTGALIADFLRRTTNVGCHATTMPAID
jgi:hypothetical protein